MEQSKMENLDRRQVLGMTAGVLATGVLDRTQTHAETGRRNTRRTPVLHATDLFRPHMDPDDHWDLACVYALAHRGDIDLKGILIDHPPRDSGGRNPDIAAVAQMNLIAGIAVPVAVGSPLPMKSRDDVQTYASPADHHGVRMVLDVLEKSPEPVVINILGSSRDIAIAGKKAPDLFASKCAATYLNAGTGSPAMNSESKLEYNVTLDRHAFAAVFDLPCPVYWMPCFEDMETRRQRPIREFGTHYKFRQSEVLPHLSEMVRNYFAYMFGRYTDHKWFEYLREPVDETLLSRFASMDRHMWCTGGFLHAAGYTVSRGGKIVPIEQGHDSSVFTFDPVRVTCSDDSITRWRRDDTSKKRFMFHVQDTDNYQSAMTRAMRSLLTALP
ncbi:MAG: nucleoside hydrolase [Planctomycetota bacterium]